MSIKQIIEAIELGDASSVTALFDKLMASKLEECIEEKKQELTESLFLESEELTEMYNISGNVHHSGKAHKFSVDFPDFPDRSDVEKQNSHLSKHHVDAVMNHVENHADDDMTDTKSSHLGAKVHVTKNTGYQGESVDELAEEFEQLDELSKKTLAMYMLKSRDDAVANTKKMADLEKHQSHAKELDYSSHNLGNAVNPVRKALDTKEKQLRAKMSKRNYGAYSATRRLAKEDVEEFLQSEEFQALDELSKTTLGAYVKKAANNMAVTHASKVSKDAEAEEVDRFTNRHMKNKFANQDKIKDMVGASQSERDELHRKTMKRMSGIGKATDRITK